MYIRPCQSHANKWNLSRCFANIALTNSRSYAVKSQDDFKIIQVSEKKRKEKDFLPGIELRKDLLKEWDESYNPYQNENEAISTNVDPEEFNSMKADFMDLDKSYELYGREKFQKRIAKVRKQVRSKHFREEKQPKLLTITEMYQINLLHKQDPVTWTPEKLSESFPATPRVIVKVLSSQSPKSPQRMLQHDMDVKHNWCLLQMGQLLGLSPDYERHLSAFSNRDPLVRTLEEYKAFQPPVFRYIPENTEFRSIITSYYDLVNAKKRLQSTDQTGEKTNPLQLTEASSKLIASKTHNNKQTDNNKKSKIDREEQRGKRFSKEAGRQKADQTGGSYRSNGNHLGSTFGQTMGQKQTNARPSSNSFSRWFSSDASEVSTDTKVKSEEEIKTSDREESVERSLNSSDNYLHESNTEQKRMDGNVTETSAEGFQNTKSKESSDPNSEVFVAGSNIVSSSHLEADRESGYKSSDSIEEVPANFDKNRTMHSRKPAYWQELERQREQEEREKERVRQQVKQALADGSSHNGQWRRLKPSSGFNQGFKSGQYEDDDNMYAQTKYPGRFDRQRMDLERIRRNKAPSIMFDDEEEEVLPEERYERSPSHKAFSRIAHEELPRRESVERDQRANYQGNHVHRERSFNSHYEEQELVKRLNQRRELDGLADREDSSSGDLREDEADNDDGYREETAEALSDNVVHASDSATTGVLDINKRMYPTKPYYWDQISRQTRYEEKQRENDVKAIHKEMEDKSMYDGKWRRLFPRAHKPRPEESQDRVAPLTARRMDTLHNADHSEESQDTYHNEHLPQLVTNSTALEPSPEDADSSEKPRPKFDYYLDEGVTTLSSKTHYTLDTLRTVLEKKKSRDPLDRDEEVLLTSFHTKEKLSDHSVEGTESYDLSESTESNHLAEGTESTESNHTSGGTQLTSYNTGQSISDPLYSGTVNYTGIVSHGVDINEQDVRVALATHVEEKIVIPKDLYKKDAIYKVDDCFYDDNGHFLYRVPGLKNA